MNHRPQEPLRRDISEPSGSSVEPDPLVERVDVHDVPLNGPDTDDAYLGREHQPAGAAEKALGDLPSLANPSAPGP